MMTRLLLLILTVISIQGISQSSVTPKFWTGGGLEYRVSKWVKLDVGYQYRTELNKDYDSYTFSDFGTTFRITKKFSLKPNFRIAHSSKINNDKNRASLDFIYKFGKKKSDWSFGVRARGQYQFHVNQVKKDIVIRQKAFVGYKLNKKISFKTSAELFEEIFRFSDLRIKVGANYKLNKRIGVKLFYAYESELLRKNIDKTHILGLMLNVKLKRKKND